MFGTRATAGLLLVVVALAGCTAEVNRVSSTEVVVRIEADADVRNALEKLRVRTAREQEGKWAQRNERTFARSVLRWPVDIVITPRAESEANSYFEIILEALGNDDTVLVQTRALTAFVLREARVLTFRLSRCGERALGFVCENEADCFGPDCRTCVNAQCVVTPVVTPESLAPFEPPTSLPQEDGGPPADTEAGAGDAAQSDASDGAAASAIPVNCGQGYEADGDGGCVDIDECDRGLDGCDDDPAACANLEGSGYRCMCPDGYDGSGVGKDGCANVDECANGTAQCGVLIACQDLVGSYQCGDCPPGYSPDASGSCEDIDECSVGNGGCDSSPTATCQNQIGAPNTCTCPAGYTGNGAGSAGCTNIDECANSPCQNGGVCTDLVNAYGCACTTGFSGKICENDVCDPSPCESGFTCIRAESGAECHPICATTSSKCAAGSPCDSNADCGTGLSCDNYLKLCLETCTGPLTVTSRESLGDVRFCGKVDGDLNFEGEIDAILPNDLPYLTSVTGVLRSSPEGYLKSVTFTELRTAGDIALACGTEISFPRLTSAARVEFLFTQTRIEMPVLTAIEGNLHLGYSQVLDRVDLRALTRIGGRFHMDYLPNLTSINTRSISSIGGDLNLTSLPRLPYSSIRPLHDDVTGENKVGGTIKLVGIGCCLLYDQYGCSQSTGCN